MEFRITRWDKPIAPAEATLREIFQREKLYPYAWANASGDIYAAHTHSSEIRSFGYDKIIYVVRGSVTWTLPALNQEIELCTGDRIDLPRGTVHGAHVGAEGVMCLEAHWE